MSKTNKARIQETQKIKLTSLSDASSDVFDWQTVTAMFKNITDKEESTLLSGETVHFRVLGRIFEMELVK